MNFLNMPLRNDVPWYQFKVTLSGVVYTVRARFNKRMNRWMLDFADPSNNDILLGLPLLLERDLSGRFVMIGLPPGLMFILDNTNQGTQPTRYSFGTTHTLFYQDVNAETPAGL